MVRITGYSSITQRENEKLLIKTKVLNDVEQ